MPPLLVVAPHKEAYEITGRERCGILQKQKIVESLTLVPELIKSDISSPFGERAARGLGNNWKGSNWNFTKTRNSSAQRLFALMRRDTTTPITTPLLLAAPVEKLEE